MVAPRDHYPTLEHAHMPEMRPALLRYAENIERQRVQLIADLGYSSPEELLAAARADITPFTKSPKREQFAKLRELSKIFRDILKNPQEYELPLAEAFEEKEAEMRRLFGEDFFVSFPAIEKAFTLKDGTKALEISPEERESAMQQLLDKLAEPDVAAFIALLNNDTTEASKWMLVYRTSAHLTDIRGNDHPVSILGMRDVVDADALENGGANFIWRENPIDGDWYLGDKAEGEFDAWADRPVQPGWMFVTKTVVEDSVGRAYPDQTLMLDRRARVLGFAEGKFRRRTPQEALFDTLVVYRYTGGRVRLLKNQYDWTDQRGSGGRIVVVGGLGEGGMEINHARPNESQGWDGACLSR